MRIRIILNLLIALILSLWCSQGLIFAEEADSRSIYVGDIISLNVTATNFSADELRSKFQAFEIIELNETTDGYLLSIRTFETGEYKINLGNKEIVIQVQSTLDEIQRDGIFEADSQIMEPGPILHLRIIIYIFAAIFALSGLFVLLKIIFSFANKTKTLSYHQLFLKRTGTLSPEYDNYFVDLTFYFKEYLEKMFDFKIIGKTSSEIMSELNAIPALHIMLSDINLWLIECDRFKFTGVKSSLDEKRRHYDKLLDIVNKIDMHTRKGVAL